jgi:hypothetical protein
MKDTEINEAIARALGWTHVHWYEDDQGPPIHCGTPPNAWPLQNGRLDTRIPNFCRDLNACVEFEKFIKGANLWIPYCNTLAMLCGGTREDDGGLFVSHMDAIDAPATKRAEAALRTLSVRKEAQ